MAGAPPDVPDAHAAATVDNGRAAAWILADMSVNVCALGLVKALGADYPAVQIVFLRATVGCALILPWTVRERRAFRAVDRLPLHALRVLLSALTLAASFHAVARVPFALFTAVNFTRPLILMAMAAWLLGESIGRRRWAAGALGLVGVLIAVNPANLAWSSGLFALGAAVVAGCAAVIVTRRLVTTPAVVLMTFYAAGLSAVTAPFAAVAWRSVEPAHWPALVAVGALTQGAQFCFLRAHALGDVGVLAPLGYLSLFLSGAVGWLGFGEVPTLATVAGSAVILVAAVLVRRGKASVPTG